ncbi:MAG: GGDEF domain-containing protein, partial [Thiobacillus sp.]
MAEPTVKINLSNPTEVARETLRRLAMRRIAPTPDNYQTLYDEIVGVPSAPANKATAETALAGLVS